MSDDRDDAPTLSPRAAMERYLRRRGADATEQSIEGWYYRLKLFVEWCESVGIETVDEITGLDLDEYYELRSSEVAPATLEGEMWTLTMYFRYLEQLQVVDQALSESVRIPDLDEEDRTDNTQLVDDAALALLEYYRNDDAAYGTRDHVYLELAWTIGARKGGLRALDVRDVHPEDGYIEFVHRPETDTPLKRKAAGQRPAALMEGTSAVLQHYLRHHRHDVHDDHGRQPFLASTQGRPAVTTITSWSYQATLPCLHGPCPHGKEPETCEWTEFAHASKCPSSRSPHQVRTGSITWQLNLGIPPEVVAERVNADLDTIEDHYDKATEEEKRKRRRKRMERDRRPFIEDVDLDDLDDTDTAIDDQN
ncbi:MAG: tyrosine-type recombinase/integrase [Halobacteriaceae archaeon]